MGKAEAALPMMLVVGAKGSGKTTLLARIKHRCDFEMGTVPKIPSQGVESCHAADLCFVAFTADKSTLHCMPLWKHYYPQSKAVIFLVDSPSKMNYQKF